ncbi:response regulator [Arenibacterium halophilum]|uniref:Response regulator n=1 Tax=Arenibacterium halophilum TaxID=2583821 RepID=A0ABY2X6C8_9RHOB|nr:response regulator [Arenibacterium halophilum]TMV10583.1 response regulator [Arenibacterium halophilum]
MLKLLHVEDDEDIREVANMALELSGEFEVLQCASGEEAIERAVGFGPDVLLLDVMMPGMSGPSTLKELRTMEGMADTPAIFMTARAQPAEVEELKSLSAIAVVVKPFDPISLGDQIMDALKQAGKA